MTIYDKSAEQLLGLGTFQKFQKRAFDLFFSIIGILFTSWLILFAWAIASIDTRSNGFFIQKRVGLYGKIFNIIKIKTMRNDTSIKSTVTSAGDPRITVTGNFFRKTKIDELPQLWNILLGQMSFVGPRPDVPGFADKLKGVERMILSIRPGITGPATLKYRNEMSILGKQINHESYNKNVIWPDKVQININYIHNWSLISDFRYILKTLFK